MYSILLLIHILAATIWTGGHIVLCCVVLPSVLKERSVAQLLKFESGYEKIGMPALIIQIITGVMLAYHLLPELTLWTDISNPVALGIMTKLTLLFLTLCFAIDARFRVIPHLSQKSLIDMAWHIIPVTVFSIFFVIAGVSFKAGWYYSLLS